MIVRIGANVAKMPNASVFDEVSRTGAEDKPQGILTPVTPVTRIQFP